MKKIVTILAAIASIMAVTSCVKGKECRIHGTVPSDKYDDKYIFLVPIDKTDSVGVDSVKIKGRNFEFVTNNHIVADIRLGYRYRFGTQNLLVVTEPGDVYVEIDTISRGWGTTQNDLLEEWKKRTEAKNRTMAVLSKSANAAKGADDMQSYEELTEHMHEVNKEYQKYTQELKDALEEGPLYRFLDKIYPTKK